MAVTLIALLALTLVLPGAARPVEPQRQDQESYRMARSLALRGDADRALQLLEAELERGLPPATVLRDSAWTDLRTHGRFRALVRTADESESWIAPDGEPGAPLMLELRLVDGDGNRLAGVPIYAYQTAADGRYSATDDNRNPRLYAYVVTDTSGSVRLHTIVPASYPGTRVQKHIHLEVDGQRWVGEVVFDDDPLLTASGRRNAERRGWPIVTVADGHAAATVRIDS